MIRLDLICSTSVPFRETVEVNQHRIYLRGVFLISDRSNSIQFSFNFISSVNLRAKAGVRKLLVTGREERTLRDMNCKSNEIPSIGHEYTFHSACSSSSSHHRNQSVGSSDISCLCSPLSFRRALHENSIITIPKPNPTSFPTFTIHCSRFGTHISGYSIINSANSSEHDDLQTLRVLLDYELFQEAILKLPGFQ